MKVKLFGFQDKAVHELRSRSFLAHMSYEHVHAPQVISFTAPTGSGKTIIMADFIEKVLFGDEYRSEESDAIFVWLSDSPQLNEQSKTKIDLMADRIKLNQCVTITDDSFDQEVLEEGHIYFLNTQKLSKSGNLTKHSDTRQYTIWETLENTIETKSEHLYVIIDEAHRGMQGREAGKATSIMQKFIKGSPADGLKPMPVVIGMSATSERFNKLVEGTSFTIHKVIVNPADVRQSGLLKDKIIVTYPGNSESKNEMAILQAATDEWKEKCKHWYQYTYEQHYANVNPVFVIQVLKGTNGRISDTNLEDCISKIEERLAYKFEQGEIVHSFGDVGSIEVNGLTINHVDASQINDDRKIKIVLFKESLTTGWDCPRAETMMSFRKAVDSTYIAQLLGRMIRTPLQMRVRVDESLNDVRLFLPHFDGATVEEIVKKLQEEEGGEIPTYVEAEDMNDPLYITATIHRRSGKTSYVHTGQVMLFDEDFQSVRDNFINNIIMHDEGRSNELNHTNDSIQLNYENPVTINTDVNSSINNNSIVENDVDFSQEIGHDSLKTEIDREALVKYINDLGLDTYEVKQVRIRNYLDSLFKIARFITRTNLNNSCLNEVKMEIVEMIHMYIEGLHTNNRYDSLATKALEFKLLSKAYDSFGERVTLDASQTLFTSDSDLDRQLRDADVRLGNQGISNDYGRLYADEDDYNAFKIDVILFVANEDNLKHLSEFAKNKFHELNDKYRRGTLAFSEKYKKEYHDIVADADEVSKHNYSLPENIMLRSESDGKRFSDHLYVGYDGYAKLKLNEWELAVIEKEQERNDFVSWLRNPSRGSYALCISYEMDGQTKSMYPDFLVFRKDFAGYVVDILEPHGDQFADSLAKAKGLAKYAEENIGVGRVQMIRVSKDIDGVKKLKRLDLNRGLIRTKVKSAITLEDFNHIFDVDGVFD